MSLEDAKQFVKQMKSDANFRNAFSRCRNTSERQKMVKDAGFLFTKEEYRIARESVLGGVITDEDFKNFAAMP